MDGENDRKPREERFPVMFMCEMLEVSRQGYYAWKKRAPSARQKEDVTLTTLIVAIHDAHKGRYGNLAGVCGQAQGDDVGAAAPVAGAFSEFLAWGAPSGESGDHVCWSHVSDRRLQHVHHRDVIVRRTAHGAC